VTDVESIDEVLVSTERYEGDIEAQYQSYWRQIEQDDELVHLLGLLASFRGMIDLSWVETWVRQPIMNRLRRKVAHYFRREEDNRWYFFHNSFRLFLRYKTEESGPNQDHRFHHELAERCTLEPAGSPWGWEEIYHRWFYKKPLPACFVTSFLP
jgi:hypothetical protein